MRKGIAWFTAFVLSLYTDIFELQDFEPIRHFHLSFPSHKKRITTTNPPKKDLWHTTDFFPIQDLTLLNPDSIFDSLPSQSCHCLFQ